MKNPQKQSQKRKIYLVGAPSYYEYLNWILPLGFETTDNLEESDCVFFAGGEDVSPALYGEACGSYVGPSWERDKQEMKIFKSSGNKPKIGICRGGQFLTVTNGYKLAQHMRHPAGHLITLDDGNQIYVTSSHHNQFLLQQNNMVDASPYKLIGWAEKISPFHFNGEDKDYNFSANYKEPEIVYYDGRQFGRGESLAIQMHPEWIDLNNPSVKYCQDLFMKFMRSELVSD